jgi:hypothetical protein
MPNEKQLTYRMTNSTQLLDSPTSRVHQKPVKASVLTKLDNQSQRFHTHPNFNNRIFEIIASLSILSTSLFGIGVLGCWGLELVDSNVIARINNQSDWRIKKHICLGWMLASFCSFVGSASLGYKVNQKR